MNALPVNCHPTVIAVDGRTSFKHDVNGPSKEPLKTLKGGGKNACGTARVFKGSFEVLERILQKLVWCFTSFRRILSGTSNWLKGGIKTCAVPHEFSPPPLKDSKGGAKNPCGTTQVFPTSFNLVFKRYQKKHCNHHFYF